MFNFISSTKEDIKEHNLHRPQIPDHTCRILIFGVSGPGKTNALRSLTNRKLGIDKIYAKNILKIYKRFLVYF